MFLKVIKFSASIANTGSKGFRFRSTTSILDPQKFSTVDNNEVVKHGNLAKGWWDEEGDMKALHAMNRLRIQFIRDGLLTTNDTKTDQVDTAKPLKGFKILDVGCGGGILTEPLSRIGAHVTGIDPGVEVIEVAKAHAKEDVCLNDNLTYNCTSIEEFAKNNGENYDALVVSEVLEHVERKELFIEACSSTLKPGGSIFFTTINRTMPAWVAGVIAAEYLLHLVPQETHDWEKFVTPFELQYSLEKYDCYTRMVHGMLYNFICNEWYWTPNTSINYALHAVKKK